jgi:hypothetical protein
MKSEFSGPKPSEIAPKYDRAAIVLRKRVKDFFNQFPSFLSLENPNTLITDPLLHH